MFDNLLVAISNIPSLSVIYSSLINKDYLISLLISCHACDFPPNRKKRCNSNKWTGFSPKHHIIWINYMYWLHIGSFKISTIITTHKLSLLLCCLSLVTLLISKYNNYNSKFKKMCIISHCIFHIAIFPPMNYFLIVSYLSNNC